MNTFPAAYSGRCDACSAPYDVDAPIGYHEDYRRPLCESCLTTGPAPDRGDPTAIGDRESVCSDCFLVHAGECA